MKKFNDLKVGTKLIIKSLAILMVILIVAFVIIILITINNAESHEDASHITLTEKNASCVESEFEDAFYTARTVAQSLEWFEIIDVESRRDYYNDYLQSVLQENKGILGVWTCWEPNALDGLDSLYKNNKGSDETGRFIPYWSCMNGETELTPLIDYDKQGSGDYYLLAKNSKQEIILDPYEYEVGGQNILITSIAVPIKNNDGKVIGVAGVDLSLSDLQGMEFEKGQFESAYSYIISNNGTTVVHPKSEAVGRNISDLEIDQNGEIAAAVKAGRSIETDYESLLTNNEVEVLYIPVHLGSTTTPWSIAVALEIEDIMAASTQLTYILIIIFVGIILTIALALFLIIKSSITKPIRSTADFAKALASGNLDESIEIKSMDEIGELTNTLDLEVRQAFKDIEKAKSISEKQSAYQAEQVEKLVVNLERLSKGKLLCDMSVTEADEDTQEIFELFSGVSNNLHDSIKTIKGYIDEISSVLAEVSSGNLDIGITSEYRGDFFALKDSINNIATSLNEAMTNINTAANQVASGTSQVSDGSQEISQGATEQASSIEELTASVTQIAEQTKQNAKNANDANEFSIVAKDSAADGNEQMKAMQNAMKEINESSENISKIIKVIDDIAFQTNILALNAAVEAARAGIHGKGFAVVAEEVRNLAARSAKAAKETTDLIEGSIKKAEAGTRIADDTAAALESIVNGVEKTVSTVSEIASASNEQATGIAQVNKGIEQLSQVVQTNSATAEEAAAAAEELSSQAALLKTTVGKFKLGSDVTSRNSVIERDSTPSPAQEEISDKIKEVEIKLTDDEFGKY